MAHIGFAAAFPYQILTTWGVDPYLAGIFDALAWFCYACELVYIIGGRPVNY